MENKLVRLIVDGTISVEDLAEAPEIIDTAKLAERGCEACKRTIAFCFGETEKHVYSYMDSAGEYEAWAICYNSGLCKFYSNWGGNSQTGQCNITDSKDVFLSLFNSNFRHDLTRFLQQQIDKLAKT